MAPLHPYPNKAENAGPMHTDYVSLEKSGFLMAAYLTFCLEFILREKTQLNSLLGYTGTSLTVIRCTK